MRSSKYFQFVWIAFNQELAKRGALLSRMGFFGIVLLIFSQLWKVVAKKSGLEVSAVDMLWYLAMTEWIVLSYPLIHLEIEEDIRSGHIAYQLTRPMSYLWSTVATGLGAMLMRMLSLAPAGLFFAYLFTGSLPERPMSLILFIPLALLAGIVGLLFSTIIGLGAFWLQDSGPLYWIWQKANFVLGGLIFPLSIYPLWLQKTSAWSPFYALLFGPAYSALTLDFEMVGVVVLKLVFWGIIAYVLLQIIYKRGMQIVDINGG